MVGRLISFWEGILSGATLVSGKVNFQVFVDMSLNCFLVQTDQTVLRRSNWYMIHVPAFVGTYIHRLKSRLHIDVWKKWLAQLLAEFD